jgi:hypothetical protein
MLKEDVEKAQKDWLRQQALWAMGYPQFLDGVRWCFGCDRAEDDCQCGHGARWLGPLPSNPEDGGRRVPQV